MAAPSLVHTVRFERTPWGDPSSEETELLPYVDGVSLVELVRGYEAAAGYDVPGSYAGLVLEHFHYGDLTAYLRGEPETSYWRSKGMIALLGCDCGEVGCWPLEAHVVADGDEVVWRSFSQPHRPKRNYADFGPFRFRRSQYDAAVRKVIDGPAV